jgi:hypothetical protein
MHLNNIEYQRSIKKFSRYYTPDISRTSSTSFTPFVICPVVWSCTKCRHYFVRVWILCTNCRHHFVRAWISCTKWKITRDMNEYHQLTNKFVPGHVQGLIWIKFVLPATFTEYLSTSSRRLYSSDFVLVNVVTTNGFMYNYSHFVVARKLSSKWRSDFVGVHKLSAKLSCTSCCPPFRLRSDDVSLSASTKYLQSEVLEQMWINYTI